MKIPESNLSTTASVPLDCEAERGKTSTPAGREKKQKTSHEVKIQERNLSTTASLLDVTFQFWKWTSQTWSYFDTSS